MPPAEVELRLGVALVGGVAEPAGRLGVVAADAGPAGVQPPQPELRLPVALVGGAAEPAGGLGVVLGHPEARVVAHPEAVLGPGMPLVGRPPVPAGGLGVVPGDAGAGDVEAGEVELRRGFARLGPDAQLRDVLLGVDRLRGEDGAGAGDQAKQRNERRPGARA